MGRERGRSVTVAARQVGRLPKPRPKPKSKGDPRVSLLMKGTGTLSGLHVTFLGRRPTELRELLLTDAAAKWDFETTLPVRSFPSYRGQSNFPGTYWSSTTGTFLEYESRLEMYDQMIVDFDWRSVAIATQPFFIHGSAGGRPWHHCPDTFVLYADGRKQVRDVKSRKDLEDFKEQFDRTRAACAQVGWDYEVSSEPDEAYLRNVSWLAGYRRPLVDEGNYAEALVEACAEPVPFLNAVAEVGDPVLVLPVAYQLLWRQQLQMRMDRLLRSSDLVGIRGWLA